ncbi:hypothetical protein MtrunA17_Chr8g0356521 [Medicago truncatula]|uniref:Uncharacterized protein n=1 Tax=Medicago truncatula TaxID=3880 RepID=A0A396GHC3_MEDTR|nr:hypothetical protein MtrunA17_Chr8g0356521 [Medicago truncatula]
MDPWLDCVSLDVRYTRLFDLAVNKFVIVAEMFSLYWEVNGEAWKWGRRLFAWDEGFVRECMAQLLLVVLQVGVTDGWIYKLHSSNRYTIKSAYNYLTRLDVAIDDRCNHVEESDMQRNKNRAEKRKRDTSNYPGSFHKPEVVQSPLHFQGDFH